ncbi:LysR substrate-binding domain-containing protein [Burkholderia sp. BE12]|uniref:LysR substrate-binding domain-containing protein n=1 Tax=Burkholderia sp. BE12 TaxID=2082394 RepID=UPI000CF4667B|nr:LysR substrate-binding domain-containing protein [Burkholderia sp. BE12]
MIRIPTYRWNSTPIAMNRTKKLRMERSPSLHYRVRDKRRTGRDARCRASRHTHDGTQIPAATTGRGRRCGAVRLCGASPDNRPSARRRVHASTSFVATLDHDFIGLHEASTIHAFLKRATADMQRMPRRRIRVSNFEAACRMIEANVGVLPEGTARRLVKTMALRLVALEGDGAERELPICVADADALPRFACDLVDLLVEDVRSRSGLTRFG